jgi:DNA-binding transcriptional LysR family regulator
MELRQLQTFLKVAEHLNFTRASEALNYAQSSVTAHVAALEAELGVLLFERLGKRIVLTEAGIRLRTYADQLLRLADEAATAVRAFEEPAGTLVIGTPESLCTYRLPMVLRAFRQRHPNVQIVFKPGICTELKRDISEGLLDLSFVLEEAQEGPPLEFEPLIPEELLLLAAPDHPLAARPELTPQDLEGETLLVTEPYCTYRTLWERQLMVAKVRPATVMEFASVEAIKQCTMEGIGITVLPAVAVQAELRQGRLRVLPWSWDGVQMITQMVWHRDKWQSPALQAFLAITRQTLQVAAYAPRAIPA